MSLSGKVALVTGGSRGIGKAIVLKLASEGADVIINYFRNRQAAEEVAGEAVANGVNVKIIKANVGDAAKVEKMFEAIRQEFGRLDILVNNAASGVARSVLDIDAQAWDWTMNINARAFLLCAQRAAELMNGRGGKIVAVSSLGSFLAWPGYSVVGVSKAALEALTRYLAVELAPAGISVNAVSAAAVQTDTLKLYTRNDLGAGEGWQKNKAGRMVVPEDIASTVAFLCNDDAYMIRGQTIIIDGGIALSPLQPE
ncbi:MAG: enoyl-[acyl-carrier-protein] reductase FabL [Dehalococcoidia bacterium]